MSKHSLPFLCSISWVFRKVLAIYLNVSHNYKSLKDQSAPCVPKKNFFNIHYALCKSISKCHTVLIIWEAHFLCKQQLMLKWQSKSQLCAAVQGLLKIWSSHEIQFQYYQSCLTIFSKTLYRKIVDFTGPHNMLRADWLYILRISSFEQFLKMLILPL